METIIFGGSFNPPTLAHSKIIEACQVQCPESEIWVMPSGPRIDKANQLDVDHRINLINAMIDELPNKTGVDISEIEIHDVQTRTLETVNKLNKQYPDREFKYIFGADSYASMPGWIGGQELQRTLPMLIIPRLGVAAVNLYNSTKYLEVSIPEISSTEVRQKITKNQCIKGLVCKGVADYIRQHKLYL